MATPDEFGVLGPVQPPVQAEDRVVLDQDVAQRGLRDDAGREADDDDAALEGDGLRGHVVGRAADGVEDDIGAPPAGRGLDDADDVVAGAVDDDVGTDLLGGHRLERAAHHGDDLGAGGAAELDGRTADTADRRVHQQGLPHPQAGPPVQAEPGGLVGDEEGGRRHVVQAGRGGQRVAGRGDGIAGEGAVRQGGDADDTLADTVRVDAPPDGDDDAAELDAGGERQARPLLVLAAGEEQVGEVQGGREHLDQHLIGTRPRNRRLDETQGVDGVAELIDLPCGHPLGQAHGQIPPASSRPPSMTIVCPVIHPASSDARNATADATSPRDTEAAQGVAGGHLLLATLVEHRREHRLDHGGRHGVDPDAGGELEGELAGGVDERGLARAVDADGRRRAQPGDRRDVDDGGARPLAEAREPRLLHPGVGGAHVHPEDLQHGGGVHARHRAGDRVDARVVHEDVDLPERLDRGLHGRGSVRRVVGLARDPERDVGPAELLDGEAEGLHATGRDRDPGALGDQPPRDGEADPPAGTGDDGDPALEPPAGRSRRRELHGTRVTRRPREIERHNDRTMIWCPIPIPTLCPIPPRPIPPPTSGPERAHRPAPGARPGTRGRRRTGHLRRGEPAAAVGPGVRRPGPGAVADRRATDRRRGAAGAFPARLLPAGRGLQRADHLRRRAAAGTAGPSRRDGSTRCSSGGRSSR